MDDSIRYCGFHHQKALVWCADSPSLHPLLGSCPGLFDKYGLKFLLSSLCLCLTHFLSLLLLSVQHGKMDRKTLKSVAIFAHHSLCEITSPL